MEYNPPVQMPTWLIDRLREEGAIIKAAPLSFALVVILSLLIAFFAARWIYSERLNSAKELLGFYKDKSSISQLKPDQVETLEKSWKSAKKEVVRHKKFKNEEVLLDGFSYEECEFENVTFVFNGDAPFDLVKNKIQGAVLKTKSPSISGFLQLLKEFGFVKPEIKWID